MLICRIHTDKDNENYKPLPVDDNEEHVNSKAKWNC